MFKASEVTTYGYGNFQHWLDPQTLSVTACLIEKFLISSNKLKWVMLYEITTLNRPYGSFWNFFLNDVFPLSGPAGILLPCSMQQPQT